MKQVVQVLLICVLLSFFGNYKSRRIVSTCGSAPSNKSKLYQFAIGCITELGGNQNIDKCLPCEWKNGSPAVEKSIAHVSSHTSIWEKIGNAIGIAINVVCIAKSIVQSIINWFTSSTKRRMRRFFLQGKTNLLNTRWFGSTAWNWIKRTVSAAAREIARGVSTVYHTVKNGVVSATKWIGRQVGKIAKVIKNVISGIIQRVVNFFNTIRKKVVGFFQSPLIKNMIKIIKCIGGLGFMAFKFKSIASGLAEKIVDIANFPVGWIKIIIGLICNWSNLKQAVRFLLRAVSASNQASKWNLYGRFAGKLLETISNA